MAKRTKEEKTEAIETLKRFGVKPGATVYTIITKVARSGMSRHIRCFVVTKLTYNDAGKRRSRHEISDITGLVAAVTGIRQDKAGWDLVVGGAGMDMGFHVVYSLGVAMGIEAYSLKHGRL